MSCHQDDRDDHRVDHIDHIGLVDYGETCNEGGGDGGHADHGSNDDGGGHVDNGSNGDVGGGHHVDNGSNDDDDGDDGSSPGMLISAQLLLKS